MLPTRCAWEGRHTYGRDAPMAWATGSSARAQRLPKDWQAIRLRVLRRDRYTCRARMADGTLCVERANQVDHIIAGDDHSMRNLQALCRWHHARKSSAEGAAARKANPRPSRYNKREAHPGLLP